MDPNSDVHSGHQVESDGVTDRLDRGTGDDVLAFGVDVWSRSRYPVLATVDTETLTEDDVVAALVLSRRHEKPERWDEIEEDED